MVLVQTGQVHSAYAVGGVRQAGSAQVRSPWTSGSLAQRGFSSEGRHPVSGRPATDSSAHHRLRVVAAVLEAGLRLPPEAALSGQWVLNSSVCQNLPRGSSKCKCWVLPRASGSRSVFLTGSQMLLQL